jgi:hypothetical protein
LAITYRSDTIRVSFFDPRSPIILKWNRLLSSVLLSVFPVPLMAEEAVGLNSAEHALLTKD